MIPKDEEFDVFVSEGVLVEVWRGEHVSVAQQFGEKWDGDVHSALHHRVFSTPSPLTDRNASALFQSWHLRARRGALLVVLAWAVVLLVCLSICLGRSW